MVTITAAIAVLAFAACAAASTAYFVYQLQVAQGILSRRLDQLLYAMVGVMVGVTMCAYSVPRVFASSDGKPAAYIALAVVMGAVAAVIAIAQAQEVTASRYARARREVLKRREAEQPSFLDAAFG